ncbi:MAG: SBBP repeat-containing protein [Acidobacteria bacterium]|nr:SBBP repeat-containing protein [Acidobacteriota bacterium]
MLAAAGVSISPELAFEPNRGQFGGAVSYGARAQGYAVGVDGHTFRLKLGKGAGASTDVSLSFEGANPASQPSGRRLLAGRSNYIGYDPKARIADVPRFAEVWYADLYPGVDLRLYGNERNLEYDLIVAPGSSAAGIVLGISGQGARITPEGDLAIEGAESPFLLRKPVAWQEIRGNRQSVAAVYRGLGHGRFTFEIGSYDASRPLIIDPIMAYSSVFGGSQTDNSWGIAVDASGNIYITGYTSWAPWTALSTPAPTELASAFTGSAIFIIKLDPSGQTVLYQTFITAFDTDPGGIAVDASGNTYVAGTASIWHALPSTPGAFQSGSSNQVTYVGFALKLNASGSDLVYLTYLGGSSGWDSVYGMALDSSGRMWVTGGTRSSDFPVTPGSYRTTSSGITAFVSAVAADGKSLAYSTFIGAGEGRAIALDPSGNVVIAGVTEDSAFPVTAGAPQGSKEFGSDCFVAKLTPTLSALQFSTFMGGGGDDNCTAVATDANGNVYVTGSTDSAYRFPTTHVLGAGGAKDVFVTKINSAGSQFVYATLFGGGAYDRGRAIAVDASGNAWIGGDTQSVDFPVTADAAKGQLIGIDGFAGFYSDGFVLELNASGSAAIYSTFWGGSDSYDAVMALALDASSNVYLTGFGGSWDFPITQNALLSGRQSAQGGDVFVARLSPGSCAFTVTPSQIVLGNDGGQVSVHVDTAASCPWTLTGMTQWAWLVSRTAGLGSGDVQLLVSANTGPDRSRTLLVAGKPVAISQTGNCTYNVSITNTTIPSSGSGGETISVTTADGCVWYSSTDVDWIFMGYPPTLSHNQSGSTGFTVAANTSAQTRVGHITAAGKTFTITETGSGSCGYSLVTNSLTTGASGGSGVVSVTTTSGCQWSGTTASSWITIFTGTVTGSGTLDFWVDANPGSARIGIITVAGLTYTVNQFAGTSTTPAGPMLSFYPVTPCRAVDTRSDQHKTGAFGPPSLPGYSTRQFSITGSGCGVPSTAQAFSLNMTVHPWSGLDWLSTFPAGDPYPGVSTLNAPGGGYVANAAIVPAGANGGISVVGGQQTDLIVDVNGYFAPPASGELVFYPVTPCRLADTRSDQGKTGAFGPPALRGYSQRDFPVGGNCGVPTTAQAYALNVTAFPQGRLSFLSMWPQGQPYPNVSTLNSEDGNIIANAAIVPAGASGGVTIVSGEAADLVIDVNGYFAPPATGGLHFYTLTPCRVADTRSDQGKTGPFGPPRLEAYSQRTFPITASGCNLPATAQAYSLNMTVIPPGPVDFLSMWPGGGYYTGASTLNSPAGRMIANAAIIPAGSNGDITVVTGKPTHVVIDINGYFAP